MRLRSLQAQLPWRSKYSAEFERGPSWRHFGHALLHDGKAIGHLLELVDELDHNGQDFLNLNGPALLRDEISCQVCSGRCPDTGTASR